MWLSISDVNSREIAFPGRESQYPGLDRDSISPEYIPFTCVIGVGSPAGVRREWGDRRPVGWHAQNGRGKVRGSATGQAQRPSAPRRRVGASLPPPSDTAGQSVDVAGGMGT